MKYKIQFHKTIVDPEERAIRLTRAFALFEPVAKPNVDKMVPQIQLKDLELTQKNLGGLTPQEEEELSRIITRLSEEICRTGVEKESDAANRKS